MDSQEETGKDLSRSSGQDHAPLGDLNDVSQSSTSHSSHSEVFKSLESLILNDNDDHVSQASPLHTQQKDSISSFHSTLESQEDFVTPPETPQSDVEHFDSLSNESNSQDDANQMPEILLPPIPPKVILLPPISPKVTLLPPISPKVMLLPPISPKVTLLPPITPKVIFESSSVPESDSSQVNTNHYLAGNSSSYPKDPVVLLRKSKVLKKRKESKLLSGESSAKSASPLAPRRAIFHSENACQTDGIVDKLERLELPGLVAVQQHAGVPVAGRAGCSLQDIRSKQTVLCSAINAKFHGSVGAVLVPLDNLSVRSTDANQSEHAIPSRRGVTVDMHTNFHTSRSNKDAPRGAGHNVDAHVTYREPNQSKGHGPQWKVDIDGSGLQVIVNMTDESKKKIKPKNKVQRTSLSHWPKKNKLFLTKAAKKRLEWLEDEAEEKHVLRLERARDGAQFAATPKKSREEILQLEKPARNSLTNVETTSMENHLQRMIKADFIKEKRVRSMPERPNHIPPPNLLPSSPIMGVYEDENTKRMRKAREFYNNLSIKQTSKL